MTRRSMMWTAAAVIYTVVNVGGAVYAIVMAEPLHAALHVVLLLVGARVWSRYGPARREAMAAVGSSDELTDRFRNLEHSLDAVAIEVERIGEGQRHMTDLLVDRDAAPASSEGAPERSAVRPDRSSS
jgi:hypothetical protein